MRVEKERVEECEQRIESRGVRIEKECNRER